MEKQTLNLLRKFTYDDLHETERVEGFGSVSRSSDAIVSGGTSLSLINTDKHWNKFLSDKSNLRREAKLQLAIGVPNTPARSGIARSGATLSNLLSYTCIAGNQEWLDILTGWADDPEFPEALVNLPIRDKFAGLLEKELGSEESPLDYYSSAYNPADLTWSILTTHGGLDSTASTANTDIDYTTWSTWKTACTTVNLSLKARFTGETIREALELIRGLTNSDIYTAGNGKIKFFRFTQAAPPAESYLFNTDKFNNFSPKLDSSKILNYLQVFYALDIATNLVTNGDMEAVNSWPNSGSPTTNERSATQVYKGTYSRKIVTNLCHQGAYQNITTEVGKKYKVTARVYVTAGEAVIGVGTRNILGYAGTAYTGSSGFLADHIFAQEFEADFDGEINKLVINLNTSVASPYIIKCALYSRTGAGAGNFLRGTEEKSLPASLSDEWVPFDFTSPVSITNGTKYLICAWLPQANTSPRYYGGLNWYKHALAYAGSWPSAIAGVVSAPAGTRKWFIGQKPIGISDPATLAEWVELSFTFTAESTTSRLFLESNNDPSSTFYVDEVRLVEDKPLEFAGSYLKEDAVSQQPPPNGFGLCSEVVDGTVVWHATLASATSYADRRIQIFKNPLEVISFTSFMMGMITEIGDIIRVTNAFFGYSTKYARVHKITALNLADASISFEAADFTDIAGYSYTTPSVHDKSSEGAGEVIENLLENWSQGMESGSYTRLGQRITLSGATLQQVSFYVAKQNSPTGTVYARVRKVSDDSIIETSSREVDITTMSSPAHWEDFPFTCAPNEEVRLILEFNGGDSNNFLRVYTYYAESVIIGMYTRYISSWAEIAEADNTIKMHFASVYLATNTVDDDLLTLWLPDPPNEAGAWISWDMGSVKYSKGCRIYWGSEAGYRPSEYKIWTSVDGIEWTEAIHETEAPPASAWKTYSWSVRQIRYFKLSIVTHGSSGTKVYETDEYSIGS